MTAAYDNSVSGEGVQGLVNRARARSASGGKSAAQSAGTRDAICGAGPHWKSSS
ncbi:hypothetical protein [Rhodococcus koreensis]|uniref:hypothetical protein n=1 Tax=Rhodococcus koreensis TaxID=99653 RepID=UPI000B263CAD|nr:hypothetical protein [Rhodococcus koreensis]QSE83257.1 hypothetical protein JWS14_30935 [Rhodococcus koreensis]